jgi:hypothetical protein
MKFKNLLINAIIFMAVLITQDLFSQKTLNVRIGAADDDQEEWLPAKSGQTQSKTIGSLDPGSSDLEFGTEASGNDPQIVGLRFTNINIPKGSIILSAYIQFTVDAVGKNNDPCRVFIKGEANDSSLMFNTAVPYNISTRSKTSDSIIWNVSGASWATVGAASTEQRTPNIKLLIEQIMNRGGWKSGNPLTFLMYGTGTREVESYDGDAPKAAMLVINYLEPKTLSTRINAADDDQEEWLPAKSGQTQAKTVGSLDPGSSDLEFGGEAAGNDPQMVGMRFTNINIPKGSLITNAYIQFTVDAINKNNSPCNIIIKGEASDSAVMYNPASAYNITSRSKTTDSVTWAVSGNSWNTVGAATAEQRTSNLKTLVQSLITRNGWKSGNPLAFYMYGTGTREVESYDGDAPKAPMLVIEYIPSSTMSVRVNSADDDQEEWTPAKAGQTQAKTVGSLDPGSSDLELGTESAGNDPQTVGIRFNNINLPQGAIIQNAYIQFTVDAINKNANPCVITIKGEANDTPSIFKPATAFNITRRAKTQDSVIWNVSGASWSTVGAATADQRTSNLKPIIENLVNRSGWKSGNSMAFFLNGTGTREVESYDGDAQKAPLLVIDYLMGDNAPVKKPRIPLTTYPVTKKSNWLYSDSGFNLGSTWKNSNYKNDTTWSFGRGPLGFGEIGYTGTDINQGIANNRFITNYFRKPIIVSNLASVTDTIELQLMCDDGAVVYINGTEVVRKNLNTGTVLSRTKANKNVDAPEERLYWLYYLPKTVLKADTNYIAVEVHQFDSLSSDLLFDLALNNRKYKANAPALACAGGNSHISCFTSVMPIEQYDTISIPATHQFQAILKTGDAYSKGGTVPSNFDYTGYCPIGGSSKKGYVALNHEKNPGGVSILDVQYNCTSGTWVVDSVLPVSFGGALVKTSSNCSGGLTPWGTTVTCEEDAPAGDVNADGYEDIGWNIEIDPKTRKVKEYGNGKQEKLWAMGRMSHENIVFKQDSITSYYGEDEPDGSVYKFVAAKKTDLSSGTLYVLKLNNTLDANGDPTGTTGAWVVLANTTKSDRNNTKTLAKNAGATTFNGVEDVEISPINGQIYFTAKGVGRTYSFKDDGATVSNFKTFVGGETYPINFGSGVIAEEWGGGNDNLTFDDKGNLWVLQDGGKNFIWLVRPDHTQASPKIELFMTTPTGSEPTGMTFTPDFKYMFLSIQEPSAASTTQKDVKGSSVLFNRSHLLVIARKENFKPTTIAKPVISGPSAANQQSVQTYSVQNNPGSVYNWTISNGTQVSGGVTSSIGVKWGTFNSGSVNVIETASAQCVSSNEQKTVALGTTSIDKSKLIPGLSVYPNPTENYLVIDAIEGLQYELIDINGKTLIVGAKEENKKISIDMSSLSAGIYTLKISNGTTVVSFQISHL